MKLCNQRKVWVEKKNHKYHRLFAMSKPIQNTKKCFPFGHASAYESHVKIHSLFKMFDNKFQAIEMSWWQ